MPITEQDYGPAEVNAATARSTTSLAINGRFLSQTVTGVQRYAREVTRALDVALTRAGRTATLVAPRCGADRFRSIAQRSSGGPGGHAWEQAVLPFAPETVILNLCNTAPVMRRRQILCIHDLNVFNQPESYSGSFRLLYRVLQPLLARRLACVTSVSHSSAGQIAMRFGLDPNEIAVLPNGHEHVFGWDRDRSVLRHSPLLRRPFVLLLGSRAKHKNIGLILSVAAELDAYGLDLVIAGGGSSIFAENPGRERRSAAANVQWLGAVTDDDLAFLFSRALCLVFPSLAEGFGLPVVEAMALGCPVIASNRGSLPEVSGSAALIAPADAPGRWLAHVRSLQESSVLRDTMIARGRQQARRYSWATTSEGYLDLVDRVA